MGLTGRLLLLGFLALVPAFAIQAYDEYTLRRDREAEVHQQALQQATLASFDLERIFAGVQNLLFAVTRAPGIRAFNSEACTPYFASLQSEVPHLLRISAVDTAGQVRCPQNPVSPGLNVADRGYFQEAMRGEPFVLGDFTIDPASGRPVLPLAIPMRDESGPVTGVVVAALDLDWLTAQMRERGYPEGGSVTIADRNGVILAREPYPERFVGTRIPERLLHLVTAPQPGTLETTSQDGTRRILGYIPVTAPPGYVYLSTGIPSRQAFAAVNAATHRGAVLLGIGLLLAMGTSLFTGRIFIKRPVDRLLLTAEAWRRGDLSVRTGLKPSGGELSRIGAVFDGVAAELQQRSDALRESEARLRSLADNLPNGMVYQILAESADQRRFLYVSEGVERLLGVKAADVLADPAVLYGRIVPEDLPAMVAAEADALRSKALFNIEMRMERLNGKRRWFQLASAPRDTPAGVVWDGVALDITARKEAEGAIRAINDTLELRVAERTAELAAANRQLLAQIEEREAVEATLRQMQRLEAVGQLTSGVAHDFNNLLTVILGNAEFLERTELDERSRRRVRMVREAAERGAKLTGQLLAFSRRQRLAPQRLDLNETVSGMTELLQSTMGGSIRLETRLEPGLWDAFADPTQIELVVLNLAINARDAMAAGGTLTVETANIHFDGGAPGQREELRPGDYVMVAVRDTGTGMSEEVLAKAFEPFFTTKEVGKGSGLGLAQVYGFAKQSGGGVRIDTKLGQGTAIQVFLPRASASQTVEAPAKVTEAPGPIAGGRVLLVDDDPEVREVTASILQDLGYGVTEAGSGGAALEVLADGAEFNLLVVDFAMPGMNGAEVAREARARSPALPVLFVTGYADLAVLKGMDGAEILQKPYRADDLQRKIASVLAAAPLH